MREAERYQTRQCAWCGVLELPEGRWGWAPWFWCRRCEKLGRIGSRWNALWWRQGAKPLHDPAYSLERYWTNRAAEEWCEVVAASRNTN